MYDSKQVCIYLVPVLKSDLHNDDNIFFIIFVQIIVLLLIFYLFVDQMISIFMIRPYLYII